MPACFSVDQTAGGMAPRSAVLNDATELTSRSEPSGRTDVGRRFAGSTETATTAMCRFRLARPWLQRRPPVQETDPQGELPPKQAMPGRDVDVEGPVRVERHPGIRLVGESVDLGAAPRRRGRARLLVPCSASLTAEPIIDIMSTYSHHSELRRARRRAPPAHAPHRLPVNCPGGPDDIP